MYTEDGKRHSINLKILWFQWYFYCTNERSQWLRIMWVEAIECWHISNRENFYSFSSSFVMIPFRLHSYGRFLSLICLSVNVKAVSLGRLRSRSVRVKFRKMVERMRALGLGSARYFPVQSRILRICPVSLFHMVMSSFFQKIPNDFF